MATPIDFKELFKSINTQDNPEQSFKQDSIAEIIKVLSESPEYKLESFDANIVSLMFAFKFYDSRSESRKDNWDEEYLINVAKKFKKYLLSK